MSTASRQCVDRLNLRTSNKKIVFLMNIRRLLSFSGNRQLQNHRKLSWLKSIFKVEKNGPPFSHCVQIGDPVLRKKADLLSPELLRSREIQFLVGHMKKIQEDYNLVGLAAPQIGISLRIFVMSFGENLKDKFTPEIYAAKEMSTFPFTVFVNPEIKIIDHRKICM